MYFHKETVVRTVILLIVWVNMALSHYGLITIPVFSDETVAMFLAGAGTVWTWFKNNYVTLKGRKQRDVLKEKGLIKENE